MPNPRLSDTDRAAVSQSVKHARLVEASRKLARIVKHTDPDAKTKAARTRLEKSLTKWIKRHGGEAFDQPFSADHIKVIEKIERAINKGGLFALAMPRGHGKSTLLKWATLYCLLTGRRRYVVIVAATAEMAQAVVDFVRQQIQESDSLHAHYPHVTTYARATDGKAIKARFQLRADGKTSGIHWSKTTLVLPEVLTPDGKPYPAHGGKVASVPLDGCMKGMAHYPSNGAILEGHGLTGAIRGKWRDTKTGKVLRPDFVLLDDPQTRESAESESQCAMRERIITGDVLGLAGPRKKIAAVMPCTIVQPGDLAARFLDHQAHPEWSGETCSLVETWPDEQDGLWAEYAHLYRDGIAQGQGTKAAFDFYRANRAAMDKGAVVSWKERIRDGEVSALHTAENLLIETGDQFWAEYQNEPKRHGVGSVYLLTPEIVQSRAQDRAPGVVPDWAQIVVAATDINPSYALSTAVVAFGANQVAAVLWYGLHKMAVAKETTEIEKRRIIYEHLAAHGREIAGLPCRPGSWFIDGGGSPEGCVIQLAFNSPQICGLQAACCFGRNAQQFRPVTKATYRVRQGEQYQHVSERRDRQWIIYNADYWREVSQRGWTGEPGAPGSCSLPRGTHADFAYQCTREPLEKKGPGLRGNLEWAYHKTNEVHDYGDCMHMAYMGAAVSGIGTGGQVVAMPARKKYSQKDLTRR
jgi:hypothetical protein